MADVFKFDIFLSPSTKDKTIVHPITERLWQNGPFDLSFRFRASDFGFPPPAAYLSANAFGLDWAQSEASTFQFRNRLNNEQRFLFLCFNDIPIKSSLTRFLYIDWLPANHERESVNSVAFSLAAY